METNPIPGEWGRRPNEAFHYFQGVISVCGIDMPTRTETIFRGIPTSACPTCKAIYLDELTAEAHLVRIVLDTSWHYASPEVRKLASYVIEKDRKLATQLRGIRERLSSLYTGENLV